MAEIFETWVIYHRPIDMPDAEYVVRKQTAMRGGAIVPSQTYFRAATLETARLAIPVGKVHLPRFPDDEPHIVETWI